MIHIEIEPVWRFRRDEDGQTMLVMLDFLNEIRATGKITSAAVRAQMSYRHCWNLIGKWAAFFGTPLVEREQGRGTRLTPLGEKLVWAGQRLQARLKRGNPLHIDSLSRLPEPGVRFVNRDPQSGTRRLFDQLLDQHDLDATRIDGYERIEFTHAAVAAYVASDMADASFGVEAAARQFDLDFVRLVTEDYYFVCRKSTLENEPVKRVLAVMRSADFHEAVAGLPGYTAVDAGVVKTLNEAFRRST